MTPSKGWYWSIGPLLARPRHAGRSRIAGGGVGTASQG